MKRNTAKQNQTDDDAQGKLEVIRNREQKSSEEVTNKQPDSQKLSNKLR